MGQWKDLFLALPLDESWLKILLFTTFGLHLLFVLLMLGTALMGLVFYLRGCCDSSQEDLGWNQNVVKSHLGLKSLAVVLGVGPLLIIQVVHSMGFFTATGLYSYTWLSIIPLLIFAFLCIELFEHKMLSGRLIPLLSGILGVGALLTVPAIFTGAMSLMEQPASWTAFGAHELSFADIYLPHWIFRYLHVLGAAIVFGACFHIFFTPGSEEKKALLRRWLFGAVLFQVVVGVPLLFTIADVFDWRVLAAITLGTLAAMGLAWEVRPWSSHTGSGKWAMLLLLPVVFVAMLTARQYLQDTALAGVQEQARNELTRQSTNLGKYRQQALASFRKKLETVYDNGNTIFQGSCQPCHGSGGRGNGPAAKRLLIRAEDLTMIRADREYTRDVILQGLPGSAMPYFTVFDGDKIDSLLNELGRRFSMFGKTTVPDRTVGKKASDIWMSTCATCHGLDGSVSQFGQTLRPAPPDLQRFSLEPERAFKIITDGYPGTVMQPYRDLPQNTRRDLVTLSAELRKHD